MMATEVVNEVLDEQNAEAQEEIDALEEMTLREIFNRIYQRHGLEETVLCLTYIAKDKKYPEDGKVIETLNFLWSGGESEGDFTPTTEELIISDEEEDEEIVLSLESVVTLSEDTVLFDDESSLVIRMLVSPF